MSSRPGVAVETGDNAGYRSSRRLDVLKMLPPLGASLKVLEVGCGEGAFCASITGAVETWGIEPDKRAAGVAGNTLTRVLGGTYEDTKKQLPKRYFDLVICNDVMEHMTDHDAFMLSIQNHMKDGSYFVGSVPNVRFCSNLFNLVVTRDWHYQNTGILDRTHFRFFTFKSVRRSLQAANFKVCRLEGLNSGRPTEWNKRAVAERLFRMALMALSFGSAQDIDYLQIGFIATFGQNTSD